MVRGAGAAPRAMDATDPGSPAAAPAGGLGLVVRTGADGSFSLWSEAFGEGFHSSRGALREARETFLNPSQLERFSPGSTIRVLEVCAGTGCNLAALLEACGRRELQLDWIGLELDREPLCLALSQPSFRGPWQPQTLRVLEQLLHRGEWQGTGEERSADIPAGALHADSGSSARRCPPGVVPTNLQISGARMHWGDARQTLQGLQQERSGQFDLIWHDAFSPMRCPQLWSVEFLSQLTRLLKPEGRWISYCSAAAVRQALQLAGLQLAALQTPRDAHSPSRAWSGGTLASFAPLPPSGFWRELSTMEREHLACSAAEPYRDPTGTATAAQIGAARQQAQAEALASGTRESSSAWRRRWGLERQGETAVRMDAAQTP